MTFTTTALLWGALLLAPPQDNKARAELYVRPAPAPAAAGELRAAIRVSIEPGWHLYHTELGQPDSVGKPTKVSFPSGTWSDVRFPEPQRGEQVGLGEGGRDTWIWQHEGTIVLYAAGRLPDDAQPAQVEVKLDGLTCEDEGSCIPYKELVTSKGAGPDDVFAAFPADLRATPEPGAETEGASSQEPAPAAASGKEELFDPLGLFSGGPSDTGAKADSTLYVRRVGDVIRGAIEIQIQPGWHLYHEQLGPPDAVGKPTRVRLETGSIEWGKVVFPEPKRLEQPGVGEDGKDTWILGHEGRIVLHVTGVESTPGADLGSVRAKITGLTCEDAGSCIEYREELESGGAGPDELFAGPAAPGPSESDGAAIEPEAAGTSTRASSSSLTDEEWAAVAYPEYQPQGSLEKRSLAMWLLFAFIAGAILNVMPCVLPVVSIKILSFVQQAGESRTRIFQLGLAFSAGILAVFLGLAALAAFAGKGWGEQFQSQGFLIVMIAIVFGFSLSLFDVYEIGVPQQVGALAAQRREGMVDAFFKGMMATILATPCSGPFLGSTLAWALTQDPGVVFLIFTFVGLGMAAPYTLLTANPALLRFVPKPGPWMQTFKHLMGFMLLGTVVFLMVSLKQDLHVFTMAFLVFVGLACWIWGRYATFDQTALKRAGTLATTAGVIALGGWFSFGTLREFFAGPGAGHGNLVWEDFDPERLQRYHDAGQSVFVDFTADWCLTCKTNEKLVYESDEIVALLGTKDVVAMRADETEDSPKTEAIQRLRERLGARSIPFMAVFPGDDWKSPYTLKDLVTRGQVRAILEQCPDPLAQARSGE
jgi:suppressor for copper-sensitivity B